MKMRWAIGLCIVIGCSGYTAGRGPLSNGATLVSGLTQYRGEMQTLTSASRWPERQRAGGTLKTVIATTVGASPEFFRLVDLDVRKREFAVTMRETSVRPDRLKEMNEELAQMNDEIAALKPVIRTQIAALQFQSDPQRRVEDVAVRGLISIALDSFSSNGGARGLEAPSTKLGQFSVIDMGAFSVVRAPDGQTFRCVIFGVAEQGAGIKCDPMQ